MKQPTAALATALLLPAMLLTLLPSLVGCNSGITGETLSGRSESGSGQIQASNGTSMTTAPTAGGIENPPFDWNLSESTSQVSSAQSGTGSIPSSFATHASDRTNAPGTWGTSGSTGSAGTSGTSGTTGSTGGSGTTATGTPVIPAGRVKAVWVSQYDLADILKGKSEDVFTASFESWCKSFVGKGINTLVIQVRPFADAFYPSAYYPWSAYVTGTQGKDPGWDPLGVMMTLTKKYNLSVHAWVNPYRVWRSALGTIPASNPFKNRSDVIKLGGDYYFNPASASARELIIKGVTELAKNYAVAGIHMDDYFYPTQDASFDQASFASYQKAGGKLSLSAWRKEQVNTLMKQVQTAVHQTRPGCLFGVSPAGALIQNSETIRTVDNLYADVYAWVRDKSVDYLCPQIYFGYQNTASPYRKTLGVWSKLCNGKVTLWAGLPLYKCGVNDQYAGAGKTEFQTNTDLMKQMTRDAFANSAVSGVCYFDARSLLSPANTIAVTEVKNLTPLLLSTK